MPHRLSTARRLADLRQIYTGETASSLRPATRNGTQHWEPADRHTVAAILAHGVDHTRGGAAALLPVPDHVRRAVLADTRDPVQQRLEAAILRALGRAVLHRRPEPLRQGPVCSSVRPIAPATVGLHLRASILGPMLAELTVSGLRVVVHRRHVELLLRADESVASVSLAAISNRQWAAATHYAHALTGTVWPMGRGHPEPLHGWPAVDPAKAAYTNPMAAALLRRLRVLGPTNWLAVGIDDDRLTIHLTWAGGASTTTVAAHLTHPLGGLPAQRFDAYHHADDISLMAHGPHDEPAVAVVLCNLDGQAPPPRARTDTTAAWTAFDAALTRPASRTRPAR
ncbi:hypothetical protein [Kutzneria sp. 744]|uniref:hypothetical protein n=1 Tax=Kutzneria sp. (strain 744) TaxID=345341 RepID=UPI0003EEC0E3|nr:hypothetical protein [Kutzneria sp. 744]EWM15256.1 LigA protein [Kutzneria sp. 744]